MDFDEDVAMQDGSILHSVEPAGLSLDSSFRPEDDEEVLQSTAPPKPGDPPLHGEGIKRETAIFDYQLTKREDAPRPAKFAALPYASSQTGLVYDVRMRFHVEVKPTENDIHPEDPRRIHAIYESFADAGLAWRDNSSGPLNDYYMGRIDTRKVTKEEVCLVHTEDHWDWVQNLVNIANDDLEYHQQYPGHLMDSVYMSRQTPLCAALSAGGAIEACRAIMLGKVKNVFAIIRPPGHHAEREDAKGFCFFDNVSIATKVCQQEFGEKCRKVFILDWDVHHGNGIQQANYDDPNVLYISLHVHEKGRFYPEGSYRDRRGPYGDHLHCGAGAGLGMNVNIPWRKKGMGNADYIYAFQQVVMPIATEFQPDLVIIAAGFDAAEGDMLGGCKVTPAGYAHMTHMLMSLAEGRLAVCLEGGYNLESIARSATAVARTMMGEPPERLINMNPTITGVDDVKMVLRQQSQFWASLYPKDISARLSGPLQGVRMHDVVRRWQAETLWEEHEMIPLSIFNQPLSEPFKNQVLATQNYTQARPLLIILHDPPEMIAAPDPRTGKLELHNTWLTDIVKTYVDWAAKRGFAVIDVNLPKHVVDPESSSQEYEPADDSVFRTQEATLLLTYLWDNYIELGDSTHVFLLGTNTGHGAIINWMKAHEEVAQERVNGAISFVEDVPLQSCKSATTDELATWYFRHSRVFVAHEHNFWHSDLAAKTRKRFGKLERSGNDFISDMLLAHKDTIFDYLATNTADWSGIVEEVDPMDTGSNDVTGTPKSRLPPVGNFALSPRAHTAGNSGSVPPGSSPKGRGSRQSSPPLKTPPIASYAQSTGRSRASRSPVR